MSGGINLKKQDNDLNKTIILGIDSGGTKTQSIIVNSQLELLGKDRGGPGNYHNVGVEKARKNVSETIENALVSAELDGKNLDYAGFGIGGLDTDTDFEIISDFLGDIKFLEDLKHKFIVNDVIISYYSIIGREPGIVAVAGTGSIAFGRNPDGDETRAGGWGWPIGDEGSGAYLAELGLRKATRAYDGRGKETELVEVAKKFFNLDNFEKLIPLLDELDYPTGISPFAKSVVEVAKQGDEVALEVVERACDELAIMVQAVKSKLRFEDSVKVGCVGGLTSSRFFFDRFKKSVKTKIPKAETKEPIRNPVVGAVALVLEKTGKEYSVKDLRELDSKIDSE